MPYWPRTSSPGAPLVVQCFSNMCLPLHERHFIGFMFPWESACTASGLVGQMRNVALFVYIYAATCCVPVGTNTMGWAPLALSLW